MASIMSWQARMQASQASAHIRHVSLLSACERHSVMHASHIAMHACSIVCMSIGVIPIGRSMARIIVSHMSAQFMQMPAHMPMSAIPAI
jgi:hypothetical protein